MRFQIDDRVKLVFPNGFSESSFAPRITQNDWSERAAVYSIRDSFEFSGKRLDSPENNVCLYRFFIDAF